MAEKSLLMAVALLVVLVGPVGAQVGPVLNHCTASWTASPSADVVSYRVYLSPTAGGVGAVVGTVPAPATSWTCAAGTVSDGQHYATVTALDAAGNESARSNEFPFVFDGTAPAAASNLRVQ